MRLAINMGTMANGMFPCAEIEGRYYLIKKPDTEAPAKKK
jgi:hypothetical protein